MRAVRRLLVSALTLGCLAVLLSGCAGVPAPAPQAATAGPAVTPGQTGRILHSLSTVLSRADRQQSAGVLAPRVDGAPLALREAAYTVRAHVATAAAPTALGGHVLRTAVPSSMTWPRWFVAVTRASADAVPQVLVLTQAGPRAQYHLSASATLLPGATLPTARTTHDGAAVAAPTAAATGLALSPADAVNRYADVLTNDTASSWSSSFTDDAYRHEVVTEAGAERSGVAAYDGYTTTHTPRPTAVWALRTRGGGALVIGVLDGARSFTPKGPGIDQPLTPDLAALAGRSDAPSGLTVSTTEVVVLEVPRAGSSSRSSLVAAERGTTGVALH